MLCCVGVCRSTVLLSGRVVVLHLRHRLRPGRLLAPRPTSVNGMLAPHSLRLRDGSPYSVLILFVCIIVVKVCLGFGVFAVHLRAVLDLIRSLTATLLLVLLPFRLGRSSYTYSVSTGLMILEIMPRQNCACGASPVA